MQTETLTYAAPVQAIIDLTKGPGFSASRIISMALGWHAYTGNEHGLRYVWEAIGTTEEEAAAYYATLEEEEALAEAASALVTAGWTRSSICFRLS